MVEAAFETALFQEQTPGLAQAFDDVVNGPGLFTSSKRGNSRLEVYTADCITELKRQRKDRQDASAVETLLKPSEKAFSLESPRRLLATQLIVHAEDLENYMSTATDLQVYFISQRNSYSLLQTSYELYSTLRRGRGVSPQFNDYIIYFGSRDNEVEITPPAMRLRVSTNVSAVRSCECMYGIRFVEKNTLTDVPLSSKWSLRQCAIYYRRTDSHKGQTWIFVTVPGSAKRRIDRYFADSVLGSDRNVLEVVVLIVDTVMGHWRPYLVALFSETESHATQFLGASPDNQGPMGQADASQRQQMMLLDDRMANSLVAIKATENDLRSLMERSLQAGLHRGGSDSAALAIAEKLKELENLSLKLEALRARLAGVANLVTNFLDLNNGFALQQLGKESRRENDYMRILSERMHVLAEKNSQDASAMTGLTIVGLIYLPLTVVTNIFSTSFIGMSTTSNTIIITNDWWILLVVAAPLTILTLYAWWIWMRVKAYSIYPSWWKYVCFYRRSAKGRKQEGRLENDMPVMLHQPSADWY
ncbi:uncharacterized protein Z518_01477 [Rhinocladiella mackenziei CBS 650.93]|uniref:CorA-like transporter domain-containing protein n=1 Tax=Rhinocladiella mackenziei CBS 650.93 TaxID=1442369 RepID=A0A0D2JLP3_9EURO|nr:uncharacterized protein Z518_01477 [Rhinocladiella mackenziei CBS 650.93]KIX10395.1 hypothetical protein Z518_01477 [Rhinocladiella mackenziei CBS 650.93]